MAVICEFCAAVIYSDDGITAQDYGVCEECYLERIRDGRGISLILARAVRQIEQEKQTEK
jgi:hypothetical protein